MNERTVITSALKIIFESIENLRCTFPHKKFTIDGRLVGDIGEVNMGDPNTLTDFVKWGLETFPARHTALVLWDHGGGWRTRRLASPFVEKAMSGIIQKVLE